MKKLAIIITLALSFSSFASLNVTEQSNEQVDSRTFVVVTNNETGEACIMSQYEDVQSDIQRCEGQDLTLAQQIDNNTMNQTALIGELAIGAAMSCAAGLGAGMAAAFFEEDMIETKIGKVFVAGWTGFWSLTGVGIPVMQLAAAGANMHIVGAVIGGSFLACSSLTRSAVKVRIEEGAYDEHYEFD